MAKKSYDKDALFEKLLGTSQPTQKEKTNKDTPKNFGGAVDNTVSFSNKIGRPAKTQEEVKKYSYYLTKRHVASIKKLAIDLDTDFSSIVRNSIEEYARKHKEW